jgi:hypothetical protein
MTPEAAEAMQKDEIVLRVFPFRVGRESRFTMVKKGKWLSAERRDRFQPPNNDLYLIDRGKLLNVSREHFQIEQLEDGSYQISDRGSTCGTIVGDVSLGGGSSRKSCPLRNGSVIVVGTENSPLSFKFVCRE